MLYTSMHRINENFMIKFVDSKEMGLFVEVQNLIQSDTKHYMLKDEIDNTVWDSGSFAHKLNRTYSASLVTLPINPLESSFRSCLIKLMVRQGFGWSDIFGLHIILKDIKTGDVMVSEIRKISDFKISESRELIDGCFWFEETVLEIPIIADNLVAEVTVVTYQDIVINGASIGLITNYPNELIPLIEEKAMPDFIKTEVLFDSNHFLTLRTITTENKTLEQSILDYFGQSLANISISYYVNYGNEEFGFKTLKISNELDNFLPVNIGLNLYEFLETSNKLVDILINTEILVDGKLMVRNSQISTDLTTINPFIEQLITHPETNYPVDVIKQEVIQNTIIEAQTANKIVPIYQPIFVEFIKEQLKYERKNIYFENLVKPTFLKFNKGEKDSEQIILSSTTSDNKYYFDLTLLVPITEPSTYELIDTNSSIIIGKGIVTP